MNGFTVGETITIGNNASRETAVVAAISNDRGGPAITLNAPLARDHAAGTNIAGTGIELKSALTKSHAPGAQVVTDLPTPGEPNRYLSAK